MTESEGEIGRDEGEAGGDEGKKQVVDACDRTISGSLSQHVEQSYRHKSTYRVLNPPPNESNNMVKQ